MLCACVFNCSNSHMYVIIGTEVSGVNPAAVLHGLSLAILCIFMVEVSVFVYVCVRVCAFVCVLCVWEGGGGGTFYLCCMIFPMVFLQNACIHRRIICYNHWIGGIMYVK